MPKAHRVLLALVPTAIALTAFSVSGHDDSYISYWPAHTLVTQGEVLDYTLQRNEQSSSLLWVLLLALTHKVTGLSLPTTGWLLGLVSLVGLSLRVLFSIPTRSSRAPLVAMCGLCSLPLCYWAASGTEVTLYAWLLLEFGILLSAPPDNDGLDRTRLARTGALCFAIVLVRPEACFVAMTATALFQWGAKKSIRPTKDTLRIFCGLAISICIVLLFRLFWFERAWPLPVYAKVGVGSFPDTFVPGCRYLLATLLVAPWVALYLVVELRSRSWFSGEQSRLRVLAGSHPVPCAVVAFVVAVGGDWMEFGRFLAPAIPVYVWSTSRLESRPSRSLAWLGAAIVAAPFFLAAPAYSTGRPLWEALRPSEETSSHGTRFAWVERVRVGNIRDASFYPEFEEAAMAAARADRGARLVTAQAGFLLYHFSVKHPAELEIVDARGLTTPHLHSFTGRCRPETSSIGTRLPIDLLRPCLAENLSPGLELVLGVKRQTAIDLQKQGCRVERAQGSRRQRSRTLQERSNYVFLAVCAGLTRDGAGGSIDTP